MVKSTLPLATLRGHSQEIEDPSRDKHQVTARFEALDDVARLRWHLTRAPEPRGRVDLATDVRDSELRLLRLRDDATLAADVQRPEDILGEDRPVRPVAVEHVLLRDQPGLDPRRAVRLQTDCGAKTWLEPHRNRADERCGTELTRLAHATRHT